MLVTTLLVHRSVATTQLALYPGGNYESSSSLRRLRKSCFLRVFHSQYVLRLTRFVQRPTTSWQQRYYLRSLIPFCDPWLHAVIVMTTPQVPIKSTLMSRTGEDCSYSENPLQEILSHLGNVPSKKDVCNIPGRRVSRLSCG